jgi:hypothetical protein
MNAIAMKLKLALMMWVSARILESSVTDAFFLDLPHFARLLVIRIK